MKPKLTTLEDAISSVSSGDVVALGGNTIHRAPCAAVHELIRQGKRDLELVKTAGAYDVDVLVAAGAASSVSAGFIGYETVLGMAPNYRRAVEQGSVQAKEHACYTVIAGLRAAIQGVPFMPVAGLTGSDLPGARNFMRVSDPYTGESIVAIPAITPDVAIIHVQEADDLGNARIIGTRFEDVLMANAAKRVIVTAERIVDGAEFERTPELVAIPGFLVAAVVEAPRGAWPCSCAECYDADLEFMSAFLAASKSPVELAQFLDRRVRDALLHVA